MTKLHAQTQVTQQFLPISILNYLFIIQIEIVSLENKYQLDLECAGCQYTVSLHGNMTVYPRMSWTTAMPLESGLELQLNGVLLPLAIAINTNQLWSGAPATSRPIFNYTQQREFVGCGVDSSAAWAATTLVTTIIIKTDNSNVLHMETAQSATQLQYDNYDYNCCTMYTKVILIQVLE